MMSLTKGPSENAWGVELCDPIMVSHQGRQILLAREVGKTNQTIYFRVLDPSATANKIGGVGWNGWYRFWLPQATNRPPQNALAAAEGRPNELRLSGMDLLTVPPLATTCLTPADAAFRVLSDGPALVLFRPSNHGTIYMDRLVLVASTVEDGRETVERYSMDVAWEVRFKRSGLRDIPLGDTDGPAYRDAAGLPFPAATIEFYDIPGLELGLFDVASVPSANSEVSQLYFVTATVAEFQITRVQVDHEGTTDYAAELTFYTPLKPLLKSPAALLLPLPGLAPAVAFYGEQETSATPDGEASADIPRAARLSCALPVCGRGLTQAMAVFDFALNQQGHIADIPAADQVVPLVDGTISQGKFAADDTSVIFPTPANVADTLMVIDGLAVSRLVLGQIMPHTTPFMTSAEDGLLHLYFGGPIPTTTNARFDSLLPNVPQAMVAQCDQRVGRVALSLPWHVNGKASVTGEAVLRGRIAGSVLTGTTVAVSDAVFGGNAEADLCNIDISYPATTGFANETWTGVPRQLDTFMDILNGEASDDSADPAVLSGARSWFDYTGTFSQLRIPLKPVPAVGPPPVMTFVSTRTDMALISATVTSGKIVMILGDGANTVTVTWKDLPAKLGAVRDIFDGSADPATYPYAATAGDTSVYALNTTAIGIDTPVLLYQIVAGSPSYTITLEADAVNAGKLEIIFLPSSGPAISIGNLPHDVAGFVTQLTGNAAFSTLGLAVSKADAVGNMARVSQPQGPIGLADKAALFDLVITSRKLADLAATPGSYAAIKQSHKAQGAGIFHPGAAVATYVTSVRPESGLAAQIDTGSGTPLPGPVRNAGWIRQVAPKACNFNGTQAVTVPVRNSAGTTLQKSFNLRPQKKWTLESWIKPTRAEDQRLITFDDGATPLAATDPVPQYSLGTIGQEVIQFCTFTPSSAGIGTCFQTGVSPNARAMPKGAFTLECWVQPDTVAALPPTGRGTVQYGGIVQIGVPSQNPVLSILLTQDRKLVLQTTNRTNNITNSPSNVQLPAAGTGIGPEGAWSHIAVVGREDSTPGTWKLDLIVDGKKVFSVPNLQLQDQANAIVIIGRNARLDSSFFGRMAQLRYWSVARPISDIRRTWRTSLSGHEPGLLGDWPMDGMRSDPSTPKRKYLHNTAVLTGTIWEAIETGAMQPIATPTDSFFLSLTVSVGAMPTIEADARLANGEWNHVAVSYAAGGGLALNPPTTYLQGVYDWAECPDSSALGTAPKFAIDAWIKVPTGQPGEIGTIMAQWAPVDMDEAQGYRLWIDAAGELNFSAWVISDFKGTLKAASAKSAGWVLADGNEHHIAVTVVCTNANDTVKPKIPADVTVSLIKDDGTPVTSSLTLTDIDIAELQSVSSTVTMGRTYAPLRGAAPQAAEDYAPFRGTLGRLRYWASVPKTALLFPEKQKRKPQYGKPQGLAAQWDFREGEGRVCSDEIGGNDLLLNSSRPWTLFSPTSELTVVANGSFVGSSQPYTPAVPPVTTGQFTMGLPAAWTGTAPQLGFQGQIATISLFAGVRGSETIRAQRFMPRAGDEPRLLAAWDFTKGTNDITGGGNNISPAPPASQITANNVPLSNESPVVRNIYGASVTRFSGSSPGRIAVGSYAVGRDIGTDDQHAAVMRNYVFDPASIPDGGIQIGVMNLIYLGQVQTKPTLIGFIEGAPPVPSENLTRPYYLNPGSPGYMKYLDTATVTLTQEAGTALSFSSSSSQTRKVASDWAVGLIGVKSHTGLLVPGFVGTTTNIMDHSVKIQAKFEVDGSWGDGSSTALSAAWTDSQESYMGFSGGWEAYEKNSADYFNPEVGRRFVPDNLGYALVESLTADQFALVIGESNTAMGVIVVPNPAIPPDRNIILFPMDDSYTLAGSLDGKIGLRNAPAYPDADVRRGSYFKPVEAYAKARRIESRRARALSYYEQRNAARLAHGWNSDVTDATPVMPASFLDEPVGPGAVATPTQGLVNRYVWTADGGLYSETQATKAAYTRSFTGTREEGGGGGFHADGEHAFAKVSLTWSLDLMITRRVDLTTEKSLDEEQDMSMDVAVEGEAFLSKFTPDAPGEYGATGNFLHGAAPGKVKAYRFMTIYDPPSMINSEAFKSIIDPMWLQQSNSSMARALRSANLSNPVWRIMHRVTYVERVPPPIASRPLFVPDEADREPENLPGNAALIALVLAQIPAHTALDPEVLTNAVAKAINPELTGKGVYPPSALEGKVAWWGAFLTSARPDAQNRIADPAAATVLRDITGQVNGYLRAGVETGTITLKI